MILLILKNKMEIGLYPLMLIGVPKDHLLLHNIPRLINRMMANLVPNWSWITKCVSMDHFNLISMLIHQGMLEHWSDGNLCRIIIQLNSQINGSELDNSMGLENLLLLKLVQSLIHWKIGIMFKSKLKMWKVLIK